MIALFAISVGSLPAVIRSHCRALSSTVMSSGFATYVGLLSSGRRRRLAADAELAHQGQHVGLEPRRDDLAAAELAEGDLAELDGLPGGGDPEQLALVRTGLVEAADDEVVLRDDVLDGHVEV